MTDEWRRISRRQAKECKQNWREWRRIMTNSINHNLQKAIGTNWFTKAILTTIPTHNLQKAIFDLPLICLSSVFPSPFTLVFTYIEHRSVEIRNLLRVEHWTLWWWSTIQAIFYKFTLFCLFCWLFSLQAFVTHNNMEHRSVESWDHPLLGPWNNMRAFWCGAGMRGFCPSENDFRANFSTSWNILHSIHDDLAHLIVYK